MLLKDKVIIITGVGPGMGQAMAKIAAREGAKVALAARSESFIRGVASEIQASGGQVIAVPTDVGERSQCDALVAATVEAFGRVDGLVNSAFVVGQSAPFESADIEGWTATFNVTCLGAVRMSQAVSAQMKHQGGGAIVNVGALQAQQHFPPGSLSYAVAKGALHTATRQLAAELGPFNIRVNTARCGWLWGQPVRTGIPMIAKHLGLSAEEYQERITQRIALRVIPPEEECGRTVLLFVSDYTKMVTGAALDINGGEWMAP